MARYSAVLFSPSAHTTRTTCTQAARLKDGSLCRITACNGRPCSLHGDAAAQAMTCLAFHQQTTPLTPCTGSTFLKQDLAVTQSIFPVHGIMYMMMHGTVRSCNVFLYFTKIV